MVGPVGLGGNELGQVWMAPVEATTGEQQLVELIGLELVGPTGWKLVEAIGLALLVPIFGQA